MQRLRERVCSRSHRDSAEPNPFLKENYNGFSLELNSDRLNERDFALRKQFGELEAWVTLEQACMIALMLEHSGPKASGYVESAEFFFV